MSTTKTPKKHGGAISNVLSEDILSACLAEDLQTYVAYIVGDGLMSDCMSPICGMGGELCTSCTKNHKIEDLEAENARLKAGYLEAIEDIEDWGCYASDYFKNKHDFEGCIASHRKALEEDDDD